MKTTPRLYNSLCMLSIFFAGCASCPSGSSGSVEAPWFNPKTPTEITVSVDAFKDLGAFIDWSDSFAKYHSVILRVIGPESVGWKRVGIQFQGLPMLNGQRLELGRKFRFTLPAHDADDCCGPYLSDIKDAVFVDDKK